MGRTLSDSEEGVNLWSLSKPQSRKALKPLLACPFYLLTGRTLVSQFVPLVKTLMAKAKEVFHIKSRLTLLQPQEAWGEIDTWEAGW